MQRRTQLSIFGALVWTLVCAGCHGQHAKDATMVVEQEPIMNLPTGGEFIPTTITLEGEDYRYAVYVPDNYTPKRAWPAILFLNGLGENGDDGEKQTMAGIGPAIRANPERFDCIVVLPQCQIGLRWETPLMQQLAMGCLAATEATYNIDPRRIALSGLSLGGFGTWSLGAKHPDRFCALGPICGGGNPDDAPKLARTPIWCYHGDADPVVPVQLSRDMVAAVKIAGGDVQYTELPEVGHNAWDAAYGNPDFIAFLLENR
jgi:predicted peptidase